MASHEFVRFATLNRPAMLRSFRIIDRDGVATSLVPANMASTLRVGAIDGAFDGLVAEPKTSVS